MDIVTHGWLLDNLENFGGKTKHALMRPSAEENGESVDTDGMDHLVRAEWSSSYYEMTHHDKNVMDDNLIFIVQHWDVCLFLFPTCYFSVFPQYLSSEWEYFALITSALITFCL